MIIREKPELDWMVRVNHFDAAIFKLRSKGWVEIADKSLSTFPGWSTFSLSLYLNGFFKCNDPLNPNFCLTYTAIHSSVSIISEGYLLRFPWALPWVSSPWLCDFRAFSLTAVISFVITYLYLHKYLFLPTVLGDLKHTPALFCRHGEDTQREDKNVFTSLFPTEGGSYLDPVLLTCLRSNSPGYSTQNAESFRWLLGLQWFKSHYFNDHS